MGGSGDIDRNIFRFVIRFSVKVPVLSVHSTLAAPSVSIGTTMKSPVKAAISLNGDVIRPLAPGPGIRVGRAFDGEDEDCTLVMTPQTDAKGHAVYARELSCVN